MIGTESLTPTRTEDVYRGDAGDAPVLFDPAERRLHVLNDTAAAVWDRLDRRATLSELVADLAASFGARPSVVRRDVEQIIARFAADGLIGGEVAAAEPTPASRRPAGPVVARVGALDAVIDIVIEDPDVADAVVRAVMPLATTRPAGSWIHAAADDRGVWTVTTSTGTVQTVGSRSGATLRVIAEVNQLAVAATVDRLVLHAGAVVDHGRVALLPGSSNRGKSTLTTALVRSGAGYLTDEAAAVDRDGACGPFPKSIALDPGSFPLFPDLAPVPSGPLEHRLARREWHVVPADVGTLGQGGTVHAIVCPHWQAGTTTELTRLAPTDALHTLLSDAFDFTAGGQDVFEILTGLVSEVPVYRLDYGDLGDAVATVRALLADGESAA